MSDEITEVAAPEVVDQPNDDAVAPGAPDQAEQSQGEDSFTEFDPSEIPESGASPEWLKQRYDQMNRDYTQKLQDFGQTRRDRDQLNQIVEGIRNGDAETRRSLLPLLGMTKEAFFEAFELEEAQQEAAEAAEQEPDLDEFDPTVVRDPRVDAWEAEKAEQRQQEAVQAEAKEAEAAADEVGGQMEEELTKLMGDEPDEQVAKFIFDHAIDNPDQLGKPDVQAGVAAWKQILDQQQQQWLASRQGPRAATQGIPGSERFDHTSKEGRDALALEGVRGANAPR